ncbi:hypothetical protein ACJ73_08944 [Blastomyces percursus]|uniref:Uncharacterized protein n=1 Tax=Blastomyces percursus TaxID=1658174 RepID=A0A1J9PHA6_9EURO|nr:hypothetical protein ACJ73_08944 [Blastomyces percursus]
MKCSLRFVVGISCLILVALVFLVLHLADLLDQYSGGSYLIDYFYARFHSGSFDLQKDPAQAHDVKVGDKTIVVAKLEEEDTDWVRDELPDWQRAVYVVNPSQKALNDPNALTAPINKGHESMAYLSYIIDNYHILPSIIAFLHAHRSGFLQAWHVDAPLHDNVVAMRTLRIDYVQHSGYVNLRCNWNPGCKKGHRINQHVTDEVWVEVFSGTSTPPRNQSSSSSQILSEIVGGGGGEGQGAGRSAAAAVAGDDVNRSMLQTMDKPAGVAAACCAQFALSREQVLKRPVEDYIHFRNWVISTERDDASSGRVMEFLWHIIFGMDAVL